MATFIAHVGKDRFQHLLAHLTAPSELVLLTERLLNPNAPNLRENLQNLFNVIADAWGFGYVHLLLPHYEMGIPLEAIEWSLKEIRTEFPELTLYYCTQSPQAVAQADIILHNGKDITTSLEGQRLRYGNVLDAYGTSILQEH